MIARILLLFCSSLLGACLHADGPSFAESAKTINARANETSIERLRASPSAEGRRTLSLALFADSHEDYRDLARVVREINDEPGIDFVANLGDFTNEGLARQYERFLEVARDLKPPVLAVAGNHDVENGGRDLFLPLFGPTEFEFDFRGARFISFYSAGREDATDFDPARLARRVEASPFPVVVLTHVPLANERRFSRSDVAASLRSVLESPKVILIAAGHDHRYELKTVADSIRLQVPRVRGRRWVRVDIETSPGLRPKVRVSQRE